MKHERGNKIGKWRSNQAECRTMDDLSEPVIMQTVKLRRHYKGLKLPDAIIAATAIVHGFTLLSTKNVDFQRITDLNYKSLSS